MQSTGNTIYIGGGKREKHLKASENGAVSPRDYLVRIGSQTALLSYEPPYWYLNEEKR